MNQKFMCEVEGRLGNGPRDLQEAKLLSRIIWWAPSGLRCEADPCHAEQLLRDLLGPGHSGARRTT
eukprot:1445017-Alexandrium_andersonii.AAC.1